MTRNGPTMVFTAVLLASATLSACGGQDEPEAAGGSSDTELPCGVQADGLLQEVIDRGEVEIYINAEYPPYETVDANGDFEGLDIDVAHAIWDPVGVDIVFTNVTYPAVLPSLVTGKADMLVNVGATEERMEVGDFTIPYSPSSTVIVVQQGSDITSVEDLNGKTVGVEQGALPAEQAHLVNEALKEDGGEGFEITEYPQFPVVAEELASGRLDAIITGVTVSSTLLVQKPNTYEIKDAVGESYFALVTQKGEESFVEFLNCSIRELKESGELVEIHQEWFGEGYAAIEPLLEELPDEIFTARVVGG